MATISATIKPTITNAAPFLPGAVSPVSKKCGRLVCSRATAPVVRIASPRPIKAWTLAIAGNPKDSGDVPEAANSKAVATAPTSTDNHAPKKAATKRDLSPSPTKRLTST